MADAQARVPIQVRETEWLRAVHGLGRFVFRGDAQARLAVGTLSCTPRQTCSDRQRPDIPKAEQDQHNQDGDKCPNLQAAGQRAEREHHLRTETECKDA